MSFYLKQIVRISHRQTGRDTERDREIERESETVRKTETTEKKNHNKISASFCIVADNAVGGMCTTTAKDTKGTCTDDNAVCTRIVGGRCTCRMNYSEDSAGVCSEFFFLCLSVR